MVIPEFMRFYSYTVTQVMDEFAVTFYSLVNAMHRIKARETMSNIVAVAAGNGSQDGLVESIHKQERGLHGIVEEVKIAKSVRKK